jgi:hypothetical protein
VSLFHDEEPLRLPASGLVYGELKSLRERGGISEKRIRESCPLLCALPATLHELERRGLAHEDAHIAAYLMIECAVREYLRKSDQHQIVHACLNFGDSDELLEKRRERLAANLHVSLATIKRREDDGFRILANRILTAEQSPCGEARSDGSELTLDVRVRTTSHQLIDVLRLMTMEGRVTPGDDLGLAVLLAIGHVVLTYRMDLEELTGRPGALRVRAAVFIRLILERRWPPEDDPRFDSMLSTDALQELLILRSRTAIPFNMRSVQHNVASRESAIRSDLPPLFADGELTEAFYGRREASLRFIASELRSIDLRRGWAELLNAQEFQEQLKRTA